MVRNRDANLEDTVSVVGYVRVSTGIQIRGFGLKVQKTEIEKFCKYKNYNLLKIYKDEGFSGVKHRPEFERMMKKVNSSQEIGGVVVYCLTRFGRSTEELLSNVRRLRENGKTFASTKESFDLSTKEGRLFFGFLAVIAEYERENIIERMAEGRAYAEEHGTKSGKPTHRPKKIIDWKRIRELRGYGISWSRIAKELSFNPSTKITRQTLIKRAKEEGEYV